MSICEFFLKKKLLSWNFCAFLIGAIYAFIFRDFSFLGNLIQLFLFFSIFYFFSFILYSSKRLLSSFIFGFIFGFSFSFFTTCGAYEAFVITGDKLIFLPFAIFISFFMGIYFGLSSVITVKLTNMFSGNKSNRKKNFLAVLFPAVFIFFEFIRGEIFPKFPWNLPVHILGFFNFILSYSFLQVIKIIGIYFSSFLLIFFSSSIFSRNKKLIRISLILISSSINFGFYKLIKDNSDFSELDGLNVTIIQPNFSQEEKLMAYNNFEKLYEQLGIVIDLINKSREKEVKKRIIILPETTFLYYMQSENEIILKKIIQNLVDGENLIFGINRESFENNEKDHNQTKYSWWNSAVLLSKKSNMKIYDKKNLMIFGEYIPFKKYFDFLPFIQNIVNCSFGKNSNIFEFDNFLVKAGIMICSDGMHKFKMVEKNQKINNKKISFLIQIVNNAWFGIGNLLNQNFVIDKIRAIESSLPLIRCSNNGISAIIDKFGFDIKKLDISKRSFLNYSFKTKKF